MSTLTSREIHIYHASAGTGKTALLMDTIAKHVKEGIPLNRIAFVTYTKAAANEAQERCCKQFGVNLKDAPHFRTIHSMCFRAVGAKRDMMMDTEKYEDFGVKAGFNFGRLAAGRTMEDVDWNNMKDADLVAFEQLYRNNKPYAQRLYEERVDNIAFTQYCKEYVKYKRTFGYKDFTDLLQEYIDHDLYEDVDIACIDEAQDCTLLQWQVLVKAFRFAKRIYVVGDLKQVLYKWNGGAAEILLKLKGHQHLMETTWRVPSTIYTFVQKHIVSAMEDIIDTHTTSAKEGGDVEYLMDITHLPEYSFRKSYFFLARNKKFLKIYEGWAKEHFIPYTILGNPLWSDKDKQEFRDGKTKDWDPEKLALAQQYYAHNTFYKTPNLTIETIHGVKGREADIVVLMTDMSRLTWKEYKEDPNSEHCVFYVGCTRAKETLYIMENQTPKYYEYLF